MITFFIGLCAASTVLTLFFLACCAINPREPGE